MNKILRIPFISVLVMTVVGCSGDQLTTADVAEQAYLSAMARVHKEIEPLYFAHVSGEFIDESVLKVALNDVSNCDPDDNKVIDFYPRCVLSYFIEREGNAITVSLDRYKADGRSTNFKVNQDPPFTRWSFAIFDDSITDGKEVGLARTDVDENFQTLSNPNCVFARGVLDESRTNLSEIECELLLQEATLFFESL